MPGATIKIFLVNGDPKRLRTAELSNWTGKAIAGPRSEFDSDPDAKSAQFRKPLVSDRYTQVIISGAKHDYRGYDNQVAEAVVDWLKQQESIK